MQNIFLKKYGTENLRKYAVQLKKSLSDAQFHEIS